MVTVASSVASPVLMKKQVYKHAKGMQVTRHDKALNDSNQLDTTDNTYY